MRILLVEDDLVLRGVMQRSLQDAGHEVATAGSVDEADQLWRAQAHDVVLLDLSLPQSAHPLSPAGSGLTVLRGARARGDRTPVLVLTARNRTEERIAGLDAGADDYLGKPFNPRELLARVHAVLRRRPAQEAPGAPSSENEVVNFGPFAFDLGARTLRKNGEELPLTTGEFAMLKALVRHPRQPLSREKLAQLARGREFEPFDRSLDVQVSRLRKLIEADPASPRYIQTVWGVGYVFVPDGAG